VKEKKKIVTERTIALAEKKMFGSFCFKQKRRNSMRTKTKDARPSDPEILFLGMCPQGN